MRRVFTGNSTVGIWLRVAVLDLVVSWFVVWGVITVQDRADHRNRVRDYRDNVHACERLNKLAKDLNDTTLTQLEFLNAALVARERAVETAKTPADKRLNEDAAKKYRALINHAHLALIVDCPHAFRRPDQ